MLGVYQLAIPSAWSWWILFVLPCFALLQIPILCFFNLQIAFQLAFLSHISFRIPLDLSKCSESQDDIASDFRAATVRRAAQAYCTM